MTRQLAGIRPEVGRGVVGAAPVAPAAVGAGAVLPDVLLPVAGVLVLRMGDGTRTTLDPERVGSAPGVVAEVGSDAAAAPAAAGTAAPVVEVPAPAGATDALAPGVPAAAAAPDAPAAVEAPDAPGPLVRARQRRHRRPGRAGLGRGLRRRTGRTAPLVAGPAAVSLDGDPDGRDAAEREFANSRVKMTARPSRRTVANTSPQDRQATA